MMSMDLPSQVVGPSMEMERFGAKIHAKLTQCTCKVVFGSKRTLAHLFTYQIIGLNMS